MSWWLPVAVRDIVRAALRAGVSTRITESPTSESRYIHCFDGHTRFGTIRVAAHPPAEGVHYPPVLVRVECPSDVDAARRWLAERAMERMGAAK